MNEPQRDPGPASLEEEVVWFLTSGHPQRGDLRRDPYPFYDRLRSWEPVHKTAKGPWLITSYDACNKVLRDDRWKKARILTDVGGGDAGAPGALAERVFLGSLVFRNPPDHTRLRRIVSPLFTPGVINRRRDRTRAIARDLLESLRGKTSFDFREEFASELPVRLICELIGIPSDARQEFLTWAETVRELQELGRRDSADLESADRKAQACLEFFADLAAERQRAPGEDIISLLLQAAAADEQPLSPEEFVAMLVILHVGGHSTTTDVIATGMHHLLAAPDTYERLRGNPSLVNGAVEEMIRYDPPVTVATPRAALEDIAIGETVVPAGESVYAVLAAANRDPSAFENPHCFDIERRDNRHLAFAAGPHFCLGAHLGRQEAQEAFSLLAAECPRLEWAVDPHELDWQDSFPHRGLVRLPLAWST